jgi:dUTPase
MLDEFISSLSYNTGHPKFMHLYLFIDSSDETLKEKYINSAIKHNQKIIGEPNFYDAGFDLMVPFNEKENNDYYSGGTLCFSTGWIDYGPTNKVDFSVKCAAKICYTDIESYKKPYYTSYYTYARSSISKTKLRLANNQGIIDSGYRGNIIGVFDCLYPEQNEDVDCDYILPAYSRILQICAPGLIPIFVEIVDTIEQLGPSTSRNSGGFGSTGV